MAGAVASTAKYPAALSAEQCQKQSKEMSKRDPVPAPVEEYECVQSVAACLATIADSSAAMKDFLRTTRWGIICWQAHLPALRYKLCQTWRVLRRLTSASGAFGDVSCGFVEGRRLSFSRRSYSS